MQPFIVIEAGYSDTYLFPLRFVSTDEEDDFASEFNAVTMANKGGNERIKVLTRHLGIFLLSPIQYAATKHPIAENIGESIDFLQQQMREQYQTDAPFERLLMQVIFSFRQKLIPNVTFPQASV